MRVCIVDSFAQSVNMFLSRKAKNALIWDNMTSETPFSIWLASELRSRKLNQSQLATYLGLNSSSVNRWLTRGGLPSARVAEEIAALFRMDPAEVLRLAGHKPAAMGEDSPTYVAREIDPRAISIARLLASDPERFEEWLEIGEVFLRRSTNTR